MSRWDGLAEMAQTIETTRLLLRRPKQADADILSGLWRDARVQQFMGGVLSQQDADTRVADILRSWRDYRAGLWTVCERRSKNIIGLCGLNVFEAEIEIIYKFFPAYWGHGYATEAATACLDYGFQILKLDRVIGVTQEANDASRRILEKVGMHSIRNISRWGASQYVYELTRSEWLGLQDS